jgi:shikimate kinase
LTLILCGFKGSGKTHFGKLLSSKLQLPFFDTDALLEKEYKIGGPELYQRVGEKGFRDAESKIIFALPKTPAVISLGGGSLVRDENALHLKTLGTIIYLQAKFETLSFRIEQTPIFVKSSLYETYLERLPIYEKYADLTIDTDLQDPLSILGIKTL